MINSTDSHIRYDGSFEGFLTSVFDIYQYKLTPSNFSIEPGTMGLFDQVIEIATDSPKASRVAKHLLDINKSLLPFIYTCFLSEQEKIEMNLFRVIRSFITDGAIKLEDFSDATIVNLQKIHKQVRREVHRMHAFVRFQELKDEIWASEIIPDFNVLPLIGKHFRLRYPTQTWIINDVKRNYGIFYEPGKPIAYISINSNDKNTTARINKSILSEEEEQYQAMWKRYFKSVNIPERNNPALHKRHVPKRYWLYLIEKDIDF